MVPELKVGDNLQVFFDKQEGDEYPGEEEKWYNKKIDSESYMTKLKITDL